MNKLAKAVRFGAFLLPPLALGLASCTAGGDGGDWGGSVRDSAGIRFVENPAEGLWGPGEAWSVSEAFRIGADTMDAPYQFGRITDMAVAPDGSIFVLDGIAAEVRVFDETGVHVRTFGGLGAGPGELSRVAAGVYVVGDDRLVIPDLGNSRINWFGLDGEFLRSVPITYASGFPVRWDDDGSGELVVQRRAMGNNQVAMLETGEPLVRIGHDGEEEVLVVLPLPKTVHMEGPRPVFTLFETEPSWDLGPSGTLRTAMTQQYRIELRGHDGALQTVISKVLPRREVTPADREHYEALTREALLLRGTAPDAVQRFIAGLNYGTTFPAFNQIMEGPDGTTLVQQVQRVSEMTSVDMSEEQSRRLGATGWDVFDSSGRYLGAFDLPERFTPLVWQDAAVYGRWLDDLDRNYMMKLDLVRPE